MRNILLEGGPLDGHIIQSNSKSTESFLELLLESEPKLATYIYTDTTDSDDRFIYKYIGWRMTDLTQLEYETKDEGEENAEGDVTSLPIQRIEMSTSPNADSSS